MKSLAKYQIMRDKYQATHADEGYCNKIGSNGSTISERVVISTILDKSIIEGIFSNRILIVRIPNFVDEDTAGRLAESLSGSINAAAGGGIYESDIMPFWVASQEPEKLDAYLSASAPLEDRLRQLSAPKMSPIDKLRSVLTKAWPGGAERMRVNGREMPFGITRLWRPGSEALPHQDVIWRELNDQPALPSLKGQIGANIYLEIAGEGGELETWDFVLDDEDYRTIENECPGSYGYPRSMLPTLSLIVSPKAGDLVLINTLNVHSVRKIESGRRITISGFVAASTTDQPLQLWS
jgi:hypothetical protein